MTKAEEFERKIIEFGVVAACEWFGHHKDSDFTVETKEILEARYPDMESEIRQS